MIDEVLLEAEEKMDDAVAATSHDFGNIRTGRANPGMFTELNVEYYGTPTPLQQLASVNIPEARTVLIAPFDRSATNAIIQAIIDADLGVNPNDDGKTIRVVLPALTEERRRDYVRQAKARAEDGRISVRAARRKAKETLDRIKKDGEAGQDEVDRAEKALDAATKKHTDEIDAILEAKETDLLEI